jgi:hypothetical protein
LFLVGYLLVIGIEGEVFKLPQPHYYKHLDKDKNCNVNIELNMEQLAQMVYKANYGLHRFLSEIIDIQRKSEYRQEQEFADGLEKLLNQGHF